MGFADVSRGDVVKQMKERENNVMLWLSVVWNTTQKKAEPSFQV